MSKIRKLMVVGAMALMMMVVALPSALAQGFDWCYWGCDPSYWGAPATADTSTEPTTTSDLEDCFLVEDIDTGEEFVVCET